MNASQLNRLTWLGFVIAAGLGATSGACAKEPSTPAPALTSAGGEVETFRFAPPDGTEFVRNDRRRQEHAIVGRPIRRLDEEELVWKVAIKRHGAEYRVRQDLVQLAVKRDGKVVAEGRVREGISAELVLDRDGNLLEVKGLEKTAARLRELAAPGMERETEQVLTPEYLANLVATRYRVLFGETIGRQATPGATWTVTNPPGSVVASRKVTVERREVCGGAATCARLRVDAKVDPRAMAEAAVALVQARVQSVGGDASKVSVRRASYGVSGAMLIEPATMLSHGTSLAEIGSVTVAGPSQEELTVEMNGTTEFTYAYGAAQVNARPAGQVKPVAAAE